MIIIIIGSKTYRIGESGLDLSGLGYRPLWVLLNSAISP
jgi:hypothetical protein